MQPIYYIRLDAHKRTISCSVKAAGGTIQAEGTSPAARLSWIDGCEDCRSRGLRRWKPRFLPCGSTILAAPRCGSETGSSADAASHYGGKKRNTIAATDWF